MDYKQELLKSIKNQATMRASEMYSKLSMNLRLDKEVAITACKMDILSIGFLPKKLKNDEDFIHQIEIAISMKVKGE